MGRTRPPLTRHAERGTMVVPVAFLIILLAGLSVGFVQEGLSERTSLQHQETSLRAFELAEAGLVRAEMEVRSQFDLSTDGLGNVSAALAGGAYQVAATQEPGGMGTEQFWTLASRGSYGQSSRRVSVRLRVVPTTLFSYGLFAKNNVTFDSDVQTDSFDSQIGTYASQAIHNDVGGAYADPTGHVGSNANILFNSSARVRGDAVPGPTGVTALLNGNTYLPLGGSTYVAGDTAPRGELFEVPDPPLADFQTAFAANNKGGIVVKAGVAYSAASRSLTLSGASVTTLTGGDYFFKDLLIGGTSQLNVAAPSRIFVTGRLEFTSAGKANAGGNAQNLQVFAHPYDMTGLAGRAVAPVRLNSTGKSTLAVYAPARDVESTTASETYGAVVGRTIGFNATAKIHFDRALLKIKGLGETLSERIFWREPVPPRR